eukprot:TRINITY_DN31356_c0_g1_i1.p1 TRINITY_DN31356_c0_g1~~TRINITY_DN31356_c0_g1_i1.p1  ORF type:complete len:672 (-),score=143.21 TRINITY_DN31356_c0_g1_i1:89-2071(-)
MTPVQLPPAATTPSHGPIRSTTPRDPLPFTMPNMEPLNRTATLHQSLLSEQSALLQEQFVKFAEALKQIHIGLEELRDDLSLERQQRLNAEELAASVIATVRMEIEADFRKQENVNKQLDERLINIREEVALRARSSDAELQKIGGKTDVLRTEMSQALAALAEKSRVSDEKTYNDLVEIMSSERVTTKSALQALKDEVLGVSSEKVETEAQQRIVNLRVLETRIDEECLGGLRTSESQRKAAEETMRQALDEARQSSETGLKAIRQENTNAIAEAKKQSSDQCQQVAKDLEATEKKNASRHEALEQAQKAIEEKYHSRLSETETSLRQTVNSVQSTAASEAKSLSEKLTVLSEASERMSSEAEQERQHRNVTTLGIVSEISEVRGHLNNEMDAQRKASEQLGRLTKDHSSLHQTVQEEALAHMTLSEALNTRHTELREQTGELHERLSMDLKAQVENAAKQSKQTSEELWHVLSAVQEQTESFNSELAEVDKRSQYIETHKLRMVTQQLEEVNHLQGDVALKVDNLEKLSVQEQVKLTTRLDQTTQDFEHTKALVDTLTGPDGQRDFIESQNSQFRCYLTSDGDLAVFRKNGWGKFAGEFNGLPRWHAGTGGGSGDRPLCSVNREMQAHERDRFMSLASRAEDPAFKALPSSQTSPRSK